MHYRCGPVHSALMQAPRPYAQTIPDVLFENPAASRNRFQHLVSGADDKLSRSRRRWRSQVRYEIGDGEVRLVADSRNNRDRRRRDCPRDGFFVERPQIFERTAAAREDDNVRPSGIGEPAQSAADLLDRSFALHLGGINAQVQSGKAPGKDIQNILKDRARGEVTIPIRRGYFGRARLRAASNSPSSLSFFFSCSNANCSAP